MSGRWTDRDGGRHVTTVAELPTGHTARITIGRDPRGRGVAYAAGVVDGNGASAILVYGYAPTARLAYRECSTAVRGFARYAAIEASR